MNLEMNQDLSMRIIRLEMDEVMRESYFKRLNILVHGLKDQENKETSKSTI